MQNYQQISLKIQRKVRAHRFRRCCSDFRWRAGSIFSCELSSGHVGTPDCNTQSQSIGHTSCQRPLCRIWRKAWLVIGTTKIARSAQRNYSSQNNVTTFTGLFVKFVLPLETGLGEEFAHTSRSTAYSELLLAK